LPKPSLTGLPRQASPTTRRPCCENPQPSWGCRLRWTSRSNAAALAFVEKQLCEASHLLVVEAVAQTPGELPGSVVRVGSGNGHLVRRGRAVRREVVAHACSAMHFCERAASFPQRLYATASVLSRNECRLGEDASIFRVSGALAADRREWSSYGRAAPCWAAGVGRPGAAWRDCAAGCRSCAHRRGRSAANEKSSRNEASSPARARASAASPNASLRWRPAGRSTMELATAVPAVGIESGG
jgi:hypothetical protein